MQRPNEPPPRRRHISATGKLSGPEYGNQYSADAHAWSGFDGIAPLLNAMRELFPAQFTHTLLNSRKQAGDQSLRR
jgi:hypothetical protein